MINHRYRIFVCDDIQVCNSNVQLIFSAEIAMHRQNLEIRIYMRLCMCVQATKRIKAFDATEKELQANLNHDVTSHLQSAIN